jgi:hypothetical protein
MLAVTAAVIAHQGGWDEILFVLGPILIVVGLVRLARTRITSGAAPAEPEVADKPE